MKKLLVVAGPSAIGKTYLAQRLLQMFPDLLTEAKWYTTRQPRTHESVTDRIFIDQAEFDRKKEASDFFIAERFHNNWYGLRHDDIRPIDKHVLVNAWPALLPHFKQACFVGLTTDDAHLNLLEDRMRLRGDSEQVIKERLDIIRKDIHDLRQQKSLLEQHGALFLINDDETLSQEVIPWIEKQLKD